MIELETCDFVLFIILGPNSNAHSPKIKIPD